MVHPGCAGNNPVDDAGRRLDAVGPVPAQEIVCHARIGLHGVTAITLELVNHGDVPLVLYPGLSIAQLVLSDCEGATEYQGRFAFSTEVLDSKITQDKITDMDFWHNPSGSNAFSELTAKPFMP